MLLSTYLPLMMSFILFFLVTSVLLYMKTGYCLNLVLSVLLFFMLLCEWFEKILIESLMGFHLFKNSESLKMSFILFLISELMFFFSVFWFFFDSILVPVVDLGGVWVPLSVMSVNPFGLPFFNTLLLLSSAFFLTWSHNSFLNKENNLISLGFTIILGVVFLLIQGFEYSNSFFSFSDSVFGNIFFMSTGFHGLHVFVGLSMIIGVFIHMGFGWFSKLHHLTFEISIFYWHFVDVVWMFLFFFVYIWSY